MSQDTSIPVRTKVQRLKTRPQFQTVLAGKTLARTAHFALHSTPLAPESSGSEPPDPLDALFAGHCLWFGAMVPKRWAKRAVTRNTIKRQIYNVSLQYASQLDHAAHLVRLRCGFEPKHFVSATSDALKAAVRAELQHLFERACAAHAVAAA